MHTHTKVLKRSKIARILTSPTANQLRLSKSTSNSEVRFSLKGCRKGQKNCDLCCRICTTSDGNLLANIEPHKRLGYPGFSACKDCNVVLCLKPRMKFRTDETCFQLYHSLPTDQLGQVFGETCKTTHDEKLNKGFPVLDTAQLCPLTLKKQECAASMNAKKFTNRNMSMGEQGMQDVRARVPVEAIVTPTQQPPKKGRPKNKDGAKPRKKHKKRVKELNFCLDESNHSEV